MPCYDKKLEASREDFYDADRSARDVDCVLTTGELDRMMREKGWAIEQRVPDEDEPRSSADQDSYGIPDLLAHPGSSAGGYMHALLMDVANTAGADADLSLQTRSVRGADFEEVRLVRRTPEGREETLLRAARCYGFRNLQNLVRRVAKDASAASQGSGAPVRRGAAAKLAERRAARKREKEAASGAAGAGKGTETDATEGAYDYVEVMACPGGCVNGGGQLRPESATVGADNADLLDKANNVGGNPARWGDRAWTARVERAYWHDLPTPPPSPPLTSAPSGQRALPPTGTDVPSSALTGLSDPRLISATSLALRILHALCAPEVPIPESWNDILPPAAETRRHTLFRTQYREVQADVPGIAVQW